MLLYLPLQHNTHEFCYPIHSLNSANKLHHDRMASISPAIWRQNTHNTTPLGYKSRCLLWGDADKSLVQPGRKQATATKLGIYSTYSPQSSIHFLACCSNFCKPLKKKKIQKVVHPTRSPRQQWPLRRMNMATFQLLFQSREQVVVWGARSRELGGWSRHWKPR
jgi:hypothetical protein